MSLGTIRGQITLDVKQALAAFTAVRLAHAATITSLNSGSAAIAGVGTGFLVAGGLAAAGLGLAAKAAADFESKMAYYGAVSQSSAEQIEMVSEKALQLGQDTRYSASEVADAFVELGKAGVPAEDAVNGIADAVVALGAAADIDLAKASNIIVAATSTWDLAAEDATKIADRLAGAANASIIDIDDLGVSMKYVGGVAAALGIDLDDTTTAIALLGNAGIKGSTAGTSLRQMMVSLSGGTEKAKKTLKELGIITEDGSNKFFTAEGKAKSLAEIFQILQDHTADMSDEQRLAALRVIFNNRALSAANILTRAGADGFAEMNKEIEKTTAAEVAAERLDNLSGDILILKSNIDTMLINAGRPMQEWLRKIVQAITKVVQSFNKLSPETQAVIVKLVAVTAAVLSGVGIFLMMVAAVLKGIAIFMQLKNALGFVTKGLKLGKYAIMALRVVIGLLTGPIGIVILVISALVAAFVYLWKTNERFRDIVIAIWDEIKTSFQNFWEWIKGIPEWWSTIWTQVIAAWEGAKAWFMGIPTWFSTLWENVKTGFVNAWNAIVNFFTVTIPEKFSAAFTAVSTLITGWITSVVTWFQALPGRIATNLALMRDVFVAYMAQLPERAAYWFGYLLGVIVRYLIQTVQWVMTQSAAIYNAIITWFIKLPGRAQAIFEQVRSWVVQKLTQLGTAARDKASQIYNSVVNWFAKLPGRLRNLAEQVRSWVVHKMTEMSNNAKRKATEIYNSIVNWFSKIPGKVRDLLERARSAAVNKFNSIVEKAKNMGSRVYNGIRDWLAKIPGMVQERIQSAISSLTNLSGNAWSAAKNLGNSMWQGFKKGLGINSPSYIEEAMFTLNDTMKSELRTLDKQVGDTQKLGNRLVEIGRMQPLDSPLNAEAARSTINQLAEEYKRLQAFQNELRLNGSMISSSQVAQSLTASNSSSVRILDDRDEDIIERLDTLIRETRNSANAMSIDASDLRPIEINQYNPQTEKDSVGVNRALATLVNLEMI